MQEIDFEASIAPSYRWDFFEVMNQYNHELFLKLTLDILVHELYYSSPSVSIWLYPHEFNYDYIINNEIKILHTKIT